MRRRWRLVSESGSQVSDDVAMELVAMLEANNIGVTMVHQDDGHVLDLHEVDEARKSRDLVGKLKTTREMLATVKNCLANGDVASAKTMVGL
jgi:hypothetical protein